MTTLVRNENECTSPLARATAQRARHRGTVGNMVMPLGTLVAVGFHHGHPALALGALIAGGVLGVGLLVISSLSWRRADREELAFRTADTPA